MAGDFSWDPAAMAYSPAWERARLGAYGDSIGEGRALGQGGLRMPPPANGGRYGSPDESWWRKMAKMYLEGQKGQQQDPMDAFAARRQAAQDGRLELAPKEPLISDELSQIISLGAKIAAAS